MSHTIVIRAEVLGYCMGVKRAVDIALKAVDEASGPQKVKTLGPLIHNRIALQHLNELGLGQIDTENIDAIDEKTNPVIILRAHGVAPSTKRILTEKGCKVIDATCPRVLSSQKRAGTYASKGCTVILAGDKNHGEIIGISGYATEQGQLCYVVENSADAKQLIEEHFFNEVSKKHSVVLIAQTTFSPQEYAAISSIFKAAIPQITILDTICSATYQRQQALEELCKKVDGVIVIGGKNSANTRRLYLNAKRWMSLKSENAEQLVVHIEQASEIPSVFFALNKVGITAGASTPDELIEEVEAAFI